MKSTLIEISLIFSCLSIAAVCSIGIAILFSKPEKEDNHVSPGRIAFENRYNN